MASVPINVASATTTHLVAAPSSGFIRVCGYGFFTGGSVNVTIKDTDGTAYTGSYPCAAGNGISMPYAADGWFDLPSAKGLDLITSSGAQVSGHLRYAIVGGSTAS